ncbi:13042_t:CDS:2 [Acaulospora morrowiae]|uniref:13042_t:CDS:1 n=1 Tax=Acaulospora morrowiae TaxID=94023 RepID=A0A9N9FMZ1_9GLOM|nr:13042_t:CDS:2 [Acaulospora morrowiae]
MSGTGNKHESIPIEKPFIPKYLQNSPLDIYNRTAENPILLPSRWNFADRWKCVSVEGNQLGIGYIGTGMAAAIRSDHPIPKEAGIFYYEVDVIDSGPMNLIGIGIGRKASYINRQTGWEQSTIGYHGDDGLVFLEIGIGGNPYGPLYCSGDTIGCCLNYYDRTVSYTKNGINLGIASTRIFDGEMYPMVGMRNRFACLEVNFGARPFMYNIEYHAKTIFDRVKVHSRDKTVFEEVSFAMSELGISKKT